MLQLVYDLHDDVVGEEWSPDGLGHVHEGWLEWRGGYDVGVPSPKMHRWAQDHLVQALDEDPAWQRWWAHSGRPQLRVDHLYTPEPKRRVKVRRGEHRVTIDIERACTPLHTNERKVLWREAEAEVRAVLEIVAAKYRMPPMPTCPVLPSEPDLTGWEEAEDDDTSPWSEEVEDLLAEQGVAPELIAHLKADAEEADRESFEAHRRAGCFGG